jgi:cation diffusion facilitator CzcD-associated flavoprotein CzcO
MDVVEKVYLFQREPGWVSPKGDRDYTKEDRARLRNPLYYRWARYKEMYRLEKGLWRGAIYKPGTPTNQAREDACLEFIEREFADFPEIKEAVTPKYPYPGKRPIFNSTFYAALKHENVELVPRAVESVTANGVVDVDGVERTVDVLVMATGFQPTNYLARIEIVGVDGRTLRECWNGEPRAFLGITVPNFPNFFILYGPGTNGGEIVSLLQRQSEYAVRAMKRMMREKVTAIEVKRSFASIYDAWLQSTMEGTSWTMSNNYFTTASGKVVTQWPYGALLYGALSKILGRVSETTRRRTISVP